MQLQGRGGVGKTFLKRAGGWCEPVKRLVEGHLGAFFRKALAGFRGQYGRTGRTVIFW